MSQTKKVGDLQIAQDMQFQKKEWSVERAGWVIGLILILAALAGLFGGGPLSKASEHDGPLSLDFQRIARYRAPVDLYVEARRELAEGEMLIIQIDRRYLDQFQVDTIRPQPDAARLAPDWIIYEFQAAGTGQPLTVTFHGKFEKPGLIRGAAMSADRTIEFNHFIFP